MKRRKKQTKRSRWGFGMMGIILTLCVAAAVILALNGGRGKQASYASASEIPAAEKTGVVCVFYANTWLSLDKDGVVCANSSSRPEGIPEIIGIEFDDLAFGKKADPVERAGLEYLIRIACSLEKHDLSVERISYQNRMATLYIDKLKVELGKEDKTDEKLTDLADLYENIAGDSGTLFMQNGNANNYGYTFRAD